MSASDSGLYRLIAGVQVLLGDVCFCSATQPGTLKDQLGKRSFPHRPMANFLIVLDPNPQRRKSFCDAAMPSLDFLGGLRCERCGSGDFEALWAAAPRAPVSFRADEHGATVIWGAPTDAAEGGEIGLARIADDWVEPGRVMPTVFNGYYAAATYSKRRGFALGADLLGMFPIFWWSDGDVLLVGSSPQLFKLHPLFRSDLDLEGLVGILLLMHSVGGRTLMKDVRRLGPGHMLIRPNESPPSEIVQYEPPITDAHYGLPFAAVVELLKDALSRSIARSVGSAERAGLTLTGGRDSRLIAGTMNALGLNPVSMTFGRDRDIEMQCARAVARALHFEHREHDMETGQLDTFLARQVTWLHCTAGSNTAEYWGCVPGLRNLPSFTVSGFLMDSVVGGSHIDWAYSSSDRKMSFANFFARNNRYGIGVELLRRLLKPELFGSLVDEAIDNLRSIYKGYAAIDGMRAWRFDLHHRQRFHTAILPWQFSFASWPIIPAADLGILRVVGGIPAAVLSGRLAQDEMIRRFFPRLAELPLDRNSFDASPLTPRFRTLAMQHLLTRMKPLTRVRRARSRQAERRIYYRVFDFNGAAWRSARRAAEPYRHKLYALFDRKVLDSYLPPPDAYVALDDGIIDGSGRKLLLGLCLWARDHL